MAEVIYDLRSLGSKLEHETGYTDDDFLSDGREIITRFSARYSFFSGYEDGREPIADGIAFMVNEVCLTFDRNWSNPISYAFMSGIHSCSQASGSRGFNGQKTRLNADVVGLDGNTILRVCRKWDQLANDDKKPFV